MISYEKVVEVCSKLSLFLIAPTLLVLSLVIMNMGELPVVPCETLLFPFS